MLKVFFADGTAKECVGFQIHNYVVDQTAREGFDILFKESEDLAALQMLNKNAAALETVRFVNDAAYTDEAGKAQTAEQVFKGYTKSMGVGVDQFDYLDQTTKQMVTGMCAYFSATQPSAIELLKPQIAIAVATITDTVAKQCPDLFPDWSGADIAYKKNDRVAEHHVLYKCLQAHKSQASWCPSAALSLWTRIADPSEEYPLIDDPIRAENPWQKGQKGRTADGQKWISKIDNNVWQPSVYPAGWEAVV